MSLGRLKYSHKIFLAIFATAVGAVLIVCGTLFAISYKYRFNEFRDSYEDHMGLLGTALERVEESQAQLSMSAGYAVREMLQKGPLTNQQLQQVAKAHNVGLIAIFNNKGLAVQSSGFLPTINIFSDCSEVAKLLTGEIEVSETPLLPSSDGTISRHMMIATADRKQIIQISTQFKEVTHLLGEMAQHDEDNEYIELFGPDHASLGQLHRQALPDIKELADYGSKPDGSYKLPSKLLVVSSSEARTINWCSDKYKNAHYRLVTQVSTKSFDAEIRRELYVLGGMSLLLILFAYFLARALTTRLLHKIESIRKVVSEITHDQDYSRRVDVSQSSADEIDELGGKFNDMFEAMQVHQKQMLEAERDKAKSQIAAQVAHDIRSPLMSMSMAVNQIQTEQQDALAILRSAIQRVAGIAKKLSSASKEKQEEASSVEMPKLTLLEPVVASVVNEHRIKNSANSIELHGLQLLPKIWTVIQVVELQTALSNMLNNAFEAGATKVVLNIAQEGKKSRITLQDNGKGMPPEVSAKIFERGASFDKATGTGLGLYQAKTAVEWSGGEINVQSAPGQGTTFTITLPVEKKPTWLPDSIEIDADTQVYIVDDDSGILKSWKDKTAGMANIHFATSSQELATMQDLKTWPHNAILIIDQNLMDEKGLELIASLHIGRRAYLCTSEFDEKVIQDKVKSVNAWLLPKPCIQGIEIKVRNS